MWQVAEAKNKFSALLNRAASEGPQRVQRRGPTVVVLSEADCERCPFWEYQPPVEGAADRANACERSLATHRAARHVETGVRLSLFVMAVIFAACGVVVLTRPLAVPLAISLWFGAVTSLMLGLWGNFRSHADGSFRGFLPPRA